MATIKSYTDIDQSRKLTEILPIESADGRWFNGYLGCTYSQKAKDFYDTTNNEYIPAWSLTALLGVLPNASILLKGFDKIYDLTNSSGEIAKAENPIDACVAMIEKLNELNLL